eukprot:Clim_evm22s119 gene=Clim_evmTU22s119
MTKGPTTSHNPPKGHESHMPRHSGTGHAINEGAKKGGRGGHNWGAATDQSGPAVLDKGDPNYDDDAES